MHQRDTPWPDWYATFTAQATQLNAKMLAAKWRLMDVTAQDAAAWANLGFTPDEARSVIADGITPPQYREMEDHAEVQAGGSEALAAMRIAELLGSGALLGPDDVVTVQDPLDPNRELIMLRDELDGR